MSCVAVITALHHLITAEFATHVMSSHFPLICVITGKCLLDVKEQTVHYYCSLHQHEFVVSSSLLSLVELSGKHIGCTSWRVETHDDAPVQTNSFDCGPFACLFIKHLLHGIDINIGNRNSAALRTELKFMIDAVASPVVPATGNLKTLKPNGLTTQLTLFQQKFLDASDAWQSTDIDFQAVYDETVESIVCGHNGSSSPKARSNDNCGMANSALAMLKALNSTPTFTVIAISWMH
ncbi:hypothetical protein T11_6348 [Trichinella zimbabwensis]|uniref:Ubiquitin-like protease family profile domain-containing protein n=2 Tax=Trichinella TaxID=6333 RepID=A0A0V1MP74_9BILA|nr:hypothetical protein T11_6348 [Trichinella zimbabwensis]KRZ73601.1 hypothetical protein T10_11610 [Trichinella papuae]